MQMQAHVRHRAHLYDRIFMDSNQSADFDL